MSFASEHFQSRQDADNLARRCNHATAKVISFEEKEKGEEAPLLYDLTTLQRDANRILGYTAQQVLDYMQSLYEKKLTTYPRTDSKYLTDDMAGRVPEIAGIAASVLNLASPGEVGVHRICNSKKVSDHHAIIPTSNARKAAEISTGERNTIALLAISKSPFHSRTVPNHI